MANVSIEKAWNYHPQQIKDLKYWVRTVRNEFGHDLTPWLKVVRLHTALEEDGDVTIVVKRLKRTVYLRKDMERKFTFPKDEYTTFECQFYVLLHLEENFKVLNRYLDTKDAVRRAELSKKITLVQERSNREKERKEVIVRASLVESVQCIKMDILPVNEEQVVPRGNDFTPTSDARPAHIDMLYMDHFNLTKDARVMDAYSRSRITGATAGGISTALGELARSKPLLGIQNTPLVRATIFFHEMCGYNQRETPLRPPRFTREEYERISVPTGTSGGIELNEQRQYSVEEMTIRETAKPKKDAAKNNVIEAIMRLIKKLRARVAVGDLGYHPEDFLELLHLLGVKVENKGPDDDPDKNRIFFMPNTYQYMLVMHIMNHIFEFLKKHPMNGIGTNWGDGDANTIYNDIRDAVYGFYGDLSRQDQTQKAKMLGNIQASFLLYFLNDGSPEYYILKNIMIWHVQTAMYHIIEWPDGFYRMIWGMMMSGDPRTSGFNTYSLTITYLCWIYVTIEGLPDGSATKNLLLTQMNIWKERMQSDNPLIKNNLFNRKDDIIGFYVQGDNFYAWVNDERLKPILSLRSYATYFREAGYDLKYANCGEWSGKDDCLGRLDHEYNFQLREWIDPDGAKHNIPYGLLILKQVLVKFVMEDDQFLVFPVRQTKDYWYRVRGTTDKDDPLHTLARLHGLALDTKGTNPYAYGFLDTMRALLLQRFESRDLEMRLTEMVTPKMLKEYIELSNKFFYSGVSAIRNYDFTRMPDYLEMDQLITYRTEARRDEKFSHKQRHYFTRLQYTYIVSGRRLATAV